MFYIDIIAYQEWHVNKGNFVFGSGGEAEFSTKKHSIILYIGIQVKFRL